LSDPTVRTIRHLARSHCFPEDVVNKLLYVGKTTKPGLEGLGGGG
jgi:hypothetical protein